MDQPHQIRASTLFSACQARIAKLDYPLHIAYHYRMTMNAELGEINGRLAEFLKQIESGHEILLTQNNKPVARLVAAVEKQVTPGGTFAIRSLKGHQVLTPEIAQSELAEEVFSRK